jgi:phosphatidylserine/phosphatidylglycerophosphate/cardiolipin synthase-like enzyme
MHNKFFVLTRNEKPVAVWTGSTNLTENGIFGHSNCGHIVDDKRVAGAYLKYWHFLKGDPPLGDCRTWMGTDNIAPPDPWKYDTVAVFSPRTGIKVLDWYGRIAGAAKNALFMTFAFGMHDIFKKVYENDDGVLRFALMEKEGNGAALAKGREDIRRIRKLPNVVVAVGNNASFNAFDQWVKERAKLNAKVNVKWIHTKYMLVDPLSDAPMVLSGSANFSKASTDTNDENMLVIRNDQRIADIYFGEFMRLHAHYAFREAVAIAKEKGETWSPKYLIPDDSWQRDSYKPGHPRYLRRRYFAQT